MAANHIQEPLIDSRALARAVLCLLLAIQAGCASHREMHALEAGGSGSADTLAILPFRSYINRAGVETDIRHAICEAVSGRRGSYAVAIQPEADTVERLRAAGWRPSSAPWSLVNGQIETDSSTSLCRLSGARFVMLGTISSYSEASAASFLGSLLLLGMVPPSADKEVLQADVAIFDGRSGLRVWTCHQKSSLKSLSSAGSLRQTAGEPVAKRLPFARP